MNQKSKFVTEFLSIDVPYFSDMAHYYEALKQQSSEQILLESAEISTKKSTLSFYLIKPAVRIFCEKGQVTLSALNENGQNALNKIYSEYSQDFTRPQLNQLLFQQRDSNLDLDEDEKLKAENLFSPIRYTLKALHASHLHQHAVFVAGMYAFEMIEYFETFAPIHREDEFPDYEFFLAETLLIVNHELSTAKIQYTVFGSSIANAETELSLLKTLLQQFQLPKKNLNVVASTSMHETTNFSDQDYINIVLALQENLKNGDVFQVVPARKFKLHCTDAFRAYQVLKSQNPSPYMFYIKTKNFELFGASPETSLKYERNINTLTVCPIAGTKRRGFAADGSLDLDLDAKIELSLRMDAKENSEHIMLVDLARNDLAKVSIPGTRYVSDLLIVHRYSQVMHLVSLVKSQLRTDLDALHALQSCLLMGTLTGAPKVKAIELIRQHEKISRGAYGGAVGYMNSIGDLDTCIIIRSAYVKDNIATVQAGAGVVLDSVPESEAAETRTKAKSVLIAIAKAESIPND